jgi:hypothetical protein
MKKVLLSLIIAFCSVTIASAKLRIPVCFPCETLQTTQELPDDSEIQKLAGQKVNLSYINDEYGILWLPIWNANGRYVLSDISNTTYFEIDAEAAKILKEDHNFNIENAEPPLSFWKRIGGKLVLAVVILLLIWGNIPSKKEAKDINPTNI